MTFLKKTTPFFVKVLLFALLLSPILDCCGCYIITFRYNDKAVYQYFEQKKLHPAIKYYTVQGRRMRYLEIGDDSLPTVLFIHGAPSSLSVQHLTLSDSLLLTKCNMIAVDRPGLGKSVVSIEQQARMIRPLLDSLKHRKHPIIVAGFSFGGPIASKLVMDNPDLVSGLLLGAPAIAPGQEKIYKISYITKYWLTRWIFPRMLRVASDEKFAHEAELKKLLPDWGKIHIPVIYMQGMNDSTVYTSNAMFAKEKLVNAKSLEIIMIPNQPHFLSVPQKDLIQAKLLQLIEMTNK
jgi:pimeloyl-ACP methyl ester carboxylesterase